MFSADPEGRLFMVRNMGNQLAATEGSVEYGIYHLHTPVLLIIGHTRCGAISAASSDYSKESPAIRRELDSISIGKGLNNIEGVYANVHNQVVAAMLKFDDELKAGRLNVIGAVLDFADDLHFGAGKLTIINVNGETDAGKLEDPEPLLTKPAGKTKKNVR
jgi:carbonic anhydrase